MTAVALKIGAKYFPGSADAVLENIEITIAAGQFACLLGPSGCGKTTLLNIIAGLDRAYQGTVNVDAGARLGYVLQNPTLLPWRPVLDNLHLVMTQAQIRRGRAAELLDIMELGAYRDAYPGSLSVGMQRRVALARALAVEPTLLLMDEPFVSLDETTVVRLGGLLVDLCRTARTTVIVVTHDSRQAITLAERIIVLSPRPGRILKDTTVPLSPEQRRDPAEIERQRVLLLE